MNEVQLFNFENHEVRSLLINSEPYFVGKDVASILGYSNPRKAIADHDDDEDKTDGVTIRDSIGREQSPVCINESGLYSLILSSKMPQAKEFKHWVTSEVLPSIRKHGAYMNADTLEQALTSPDFLIKLATELKNEKEKRAELENQNKQMKPKALFADAVATSHTSILVGELAKILKQNGIDMGQKRLFAWLREKGYLIKRQGTDYNMPTQKAMELGLFEIKEGSYVNGSGVNITTKTPKVTGKGQQYFINKFLAKE